MQKLCASILKKSLYTNKWNLFVLKPSTKHNNFILTIPKAAWKIKVMIKADVNLWNELITSRKLITHLWKNRLVSKLSSYCWWWKTCLNFRLPKNSHTFQKSSHALEILHSYMRIYLPICARNTQFVLPNWLTKHIQ